MVVCSISKLKMLCGNTKVEKDKQLQCYYYLFLMCVI